MQAVKGSVNQGGDMWDGRSEGIVGGEGESACDDEEGACILEQLVFHFLFSLKSLTDLVDTCQ